MSTRGLRAWVDYAHIRYVAGDWTVTEKSQSTALTAWIEQKWSVRRIPLVIFDDQESIETFLAEPLQGLDPGRSTLQRFVILSRLPLQQSRVLTVRETLTQLSVARNFSGDWSTPESALKLIESARFPDPFAHHLPPAFLNAVRTPMRGLNDFTVDGRTDLQLRYVQELYTFSNLTELYTETGMVAAGASLEDVSWEAYDTDIKLHFGTGNKRYAVLPLDGRGRGPRIVTRHQSIAKKFVGSGRHEWSYTGPALVLEIEERALQTVGDVRISRDVVSERLTPLDVAAAASKS